MGISLIILGTPKIYTTTGFGPRKNREMAGVGALVVYIQTAAFYSSLYIHHQIVHTSHSPIFSRPKPGGGVFGVPMTGYGYKFDYSARWGPSLGVPI